MVDTDRLRRTRSEVEISILWALCHYFGGSKVGVDAKQDKLEQGPI